MVDSSAFGTALWTVAIVAAFTVALSLAALSDMAMRRREDRAAREHSAGPRHNGRDPHGAHQ
ncbi:hypothetical protein DFP74_4076 [Nocardiopsis sp. Huas11]|uniref:histidine kinase n=1 Tax=Nocardiopsis sp. Huas11 TaxID=2183912 RepID=UPI000EB281DD|nr:histidine kinase [Nocardiopsis sp. Huas11]RKS08379.1 hypothetical protein DFP74_4076 [Nocardiopsis sp. Huas11]